MYVFAFANNLGEEIEFRSSPYTVVIGDEQYFNWIIDIIVNNFVILEANYSRDGYPVYINNVLDINYVISVKT